jgi:RNA polymerase sigma-70 factor (ECF subfamily)
MISPEMRGAWRELERKLRPFVERRVSGPDADDVLQDVFLRMQRGLAGLREEERFGPWVYQVARSAILDHRRRAARRPVDTDEAPEEAVPAVDVEEDGAALREFAAYVAPFIAMLPSPYREALTLTELEGLTQKDAAAMLGVSLSGMKSRVQRGRVKLRELFQECCEITIDPRGRVIGYERRPGWKPPGGCCS